MFIFIVLVGVVVVVLHNIRQYHGVMQWLYSNPAPQAV